jgi:geranyl-CoA carboxylase alpha subunit
MSIVATPFRTILIANRGEIALRIMRTARQLGYGTVAVYSTADADARHVREADRAVCIGDPPAARSYLRIDRIVEAAREAGADAVHPGYGFLAENAAFSAACRDAGLVFIGPSPDAIRAMGNKAGAKRIVEAAGVPTVPGYQGEDRTDERMLAEAERIGFPVMIKATAGGGGRGMRLVPGAGQFAAMLRAARAEAKSAFGDPEVILERAVLRPRHIEIQVFGDRYGNAIHLGERDCSVQRRHQKIIEEAPSPAVSPALRARMGETAVAAVKSIGYEGAGTLEFLLDAQGNFYFMEMNTRLQVEHPVTEAITGLDLVAMQLRIAAGEPLPLTQQDVTFSGHAIEVRLCAENPDRNFLPQAGRLLRWEPPSGLRVEHALESGGEITPYYDSMIAKVIAAGATRDEARRALIAGLERTVALGIKTNLNFLSRCLAHRNFIDGGATTAFIAEAGKDLLGTDPERRAVQAALATLLMHLSNRPAGAFASRPPMPMRLDIDGQEMDVRLIAEPGNAFRLRTGETESVLTVCAFDDGRLSYRRDDIVGTVAFVRDGARLLIQQGSAVITVRDLTTPDA